MVHHAYDSFQLTIVPLESTLSNPTALNYSPDATTAPSAFTLLNPPPPLSCVKSLTSSRRPSLASLRNLTWRQSLQKRVCIFKHDGGRGFVEVRDFGVPDTVKSISWCGENICLGIRKEYVILNTANGTLSEVFPSGRVSPPLVTSLPSGELLLGKVRLLRSPYPLIQTVLQNIRHLVKSNNAVIVGLDNSVHVLFPVSIGAQIVQLTAAGNFEEALALCKSLPPEDSSLRAAKESSIHTRY
ncbi:hypothetical protein YC2023_042622 [Brassica napus]